MCFSRRYLRCTSRQWNVACVSHNLDTSRLALIVVRMSCPETKLKTKSGAPWSTRAAVVRDEHGTMVKDATKLADGASVTVVPVWADGSELAKRFTVRDVIGEGRERLAEGAVKPAESGVHAAVWRSQGGTKDVYSVLPAGVLHQSVEELSDDDLSEALAWSSNRDFEKLSRFIRTPEHKSIAEARTQAIAKNETGQPVSDRSVLVLKSNQESLAERERLRNMLRGEFQQVLKLQGAVGQNPREAAQLASDLEQRAGRLWEVCQDAEQGVKSLMSHREMWFKSVVEEVRHDEGLVQAVVREAKWFSEGGGVERRGVAEVSDALGYLRSRMRMIVDAASRGDQRGALLAVGGVLDALSQVDVSLARGLVTSRELGERADTGR